MERLNDNVDEVVDFDVLIIGSGSAGFLAAIESIEITNKIAVVTKEPSIGAGSASILATYPYSSFVVDSKCALDFGFPGNDGDSPEIFFEDIVRAGRGLSNQRFVKIFVEEICNVLSKLYSLGYNWDFSKLDKSGGHSFPRDVYGLKSTFGVEFANTMKKAFKERENISIFTDILVLDLLLFQGRVIGAIGFDMKKGLIIVFRAKSTILATGGAQNIYSRASVGKTLTGDGQAIALRAGAETINNEFVMFGLNVIWPPELAYTKGALIQLLHRSGTPGRAQFLNAEGEAFMEEDKTKKAAPDSAMMGSRPLSHRIINEVKEGRGSPHGGVYFSIQQMPHNLLVQLSNITKYTNWVDPSSNFNFGPYIETMKEKNFVEVGLVCHYFLGGISIDELCSTTIPGLFAAGECTGNLHGARRLGGMALSQALWEGTRAGRYAAKYANQVDDFQKIENKQVEKSCSYVKGLIQREEGINSIKLRKKIQALAFDKVGVIRNGSQLKQALNEIEYIKKVELSKIYLTNKNMKFNLELIEALQLKNIILNLEIIAKAALLRTESRGTHYRSDFPMEDNDNLMANIIARAHDGIIELFKRPPVILQNQL